MKPPPLLLWNARLVFRHRIPVCLALLAIVVAGPATAQELPAKLRVATYNISFYRDKPGRLLRDLQTGKDPSARRIAEVIQRIRPDVILLNEIDFDPTEQVLAEFQRNYLSIGQAGQEPIEFAQSEGGTAAVLNPERSRQRGNPAHDTGNFSDDGARNLRVDYVLPSRDLKVLVNGVFWPAPGEEGAEAVKGTDHRMVWVETVP